MPFVNKMNVDNQEYDIQDQRLSESSGTVTLNKNLSVVGNVTISGSLNGELTPSVKPIYYHPIYLIGKIGGLTKARVQFTILDNNSVAYTDATIITKLKSLLSAGAFINANGWYQDENDKYNCVYLIYRSENTDLVYYNNDNSAADINFDDITWQCVDGVNKIN